MADFAGRAKELEYEGRLQEALTYYEMAVEEKSGSFDIRCDQGTVLNRLRQYDEADYCFNYVLSTMDENHFNSIFGRGISSIGLNKWDEAIEYFSKCLTLDENNANVWYYLSVLYKDEYSEGDYKKYFKQFNKLDNKKFREIRNYYEFGINFKEKEIELINEFGDDFEKTDRYYNVDECIDFLNKVGFSEEKISFYINSVPIDELKNILNDSCIEYNNELEREVIKKELKKMGFEKEEIENYIKNQEIEDLKNIIISNTETDPFDQIQRLSVPDLENIFKSMPINHAYEYKIPNMNIDIKDKNSILKKLKIFFKSFDVNKEKGMIEEDFKLLSENILSDDIDGVKNTLDKIESSNISEFNDLKIKLDYFKVLINYYSYHNIQYEEIYKQLEKISYFSAEMVSNQVYIYIKSSILYDAHRYEDAIDNLKLIDLSKGSQLNQDFVYYLLSSAYYNIGDYYNAYNEYNKISSKNSNLNSLKDLFNLNGNDEINLLLFL